MAGISNHFDTMTAIKTAIDGLSLDGLTGGTAIQEVATYLEGQQTLPFISISPYGLETTGDELNTLDGIYYGTLVAIIARQDVSELERRLSWRQAIRQRLNNHVIPGLPQNYNLEVEPGNVVETRAFVDLNAFVSSVVVRAYFQEPRT